MTKGSEPPKTGEQRDAERRPKEFADKLELIVEHLGEDDFVSAVRGYRPDITKEELKRNARGCCPNRAMQEHWRGM